MNHICMILPSEFALPSEGVVYADAMGHKLCTRCAEKARLNPHAARRHWPWYQFKIEDVLEFECFFCLTTLSDNPE